MGVLRMKISKESVISIIKNTDKLPTIKAEISDLIIMINKEEDINISELSLKINECGNLREALLTNINSGYFKLQRKIESIKDAVVYLGMRAVEKLIVAYLIKSLLPTNLGNSKELNSEMYWKHCLGTSIAANLIAEKLGIEDKYRYFAYGLIHDIGYTALDVCFPEIVDEVYEIQKKGVSQVVAERMIMGGCTHSDIGEVLCEKWNLHEDIKTVVKHHHTPLGAENYKLEVMILSVADAISTLYYEKLVKVSTSFSLNNNIINELGLDMEFIEEISKVLPNKVEMVNKQLNFAILSL